MKLYLLKTMLLLCALVVGNLSGWAETYTLGWGTASGDAGTYTNFTAPSGTVSGVVSFSTEKNSSNNAPAYNSNSKELRLYYHSSGNGCSITLTPADGVTITGFVMTTSLGQSVNYIVDEGTATSASINSNLCTVTDISASSSLMIQNVSANTQLRIKTIQITYTVASSGYNITAQSNNADWGTVSLSGTTITASPATGYTYASPSYTVISGTATVTKDGNTFSVDASSDCTVQINFEALPTYTVTLPASDTYGTYTMNANNPVVSGTEVELTYTPAAGYENYLATWSVNGTAISGNKFTMPDDDVTVTVSLEKVTTVDMSIDFESVTSAYSDWTFSNINGKQTDSGVPAHGGTYFGVTSAATAYIQTNEKVNPVSVTCYVSKKSTNTSASTWIIQVKTEDAESWTDVKSVSASSMDKGNWVELTADLSNYSNVYVRVYYNGTTAVRCIDDLVLTVQGGDEPMIVADGTVNLGCNDLSGSITYSIENHIDGTNLTATVEDGCDWISNVAVGAESVTFTTTANTGAARSAVITLTYGEVTKNVTVNQAKYSVVYSYTLATEVIPGRHYIITDGSNFGLGTQNNNNRAAALVTVENSTITLDEDYVAELLLEIDSETGFISFFDESDDDNGGYLYAASNSSNHLKTQATNNANGLWNIIFSSNGSAKIIAQGSNSHNILRFNSQNGIFSCYASGQEDIYLYERVGDAGDVNGVTSPITVTTAEYATICKPYALDISETGIKAYTATDNTTSVKLTEIESGQVPANTPVVLYKAGGCTVDVPVIASAAEVGDNDLRVSTGEYPTNAFVLSKPSGYPVGFYLWDSTKMLNAGKVYLQGASNAGARQFLLFDDQTTTAVESISVNADDSAAYDLQGRRVMQPTKGLYIVNGKKVVIK